jgi:heat shock protein HtpX
LVVSHGRQTARRATTSEDTAVMNQLKTILLLGVLSAVLIGFGSLLGPGTFYAFTALAILMNVGAYFFSDRLVLRVHGARDLPREEAPRLHAMVEELAARAGIPTPRLCLVPADYANAFATGRNPQKGVVAVTEGLLRVLDEREVRGVIAHEIAHIKNRDILVSTVAATIAAAVSYVGNAVQFAAIFGTGQQADEEGGSPVGALVMAIVAPIAALMVQLGISRSREFLADDTAARLTGDPESLARALERLSHAAEVVPARPQPATASLFIVNPLAGAGSPLNLFSTHPPMERRIARLRAFTTGPRLAA